MNPEQFRILLAATLIDGELLSMASYQLRTAAEKSARRQWLYRRSLAFADELLRVAAEPAPLEVEDAPRPAA